MYIRELTTMDVIVAVIVVLVIIVLMFATLRMFLDLRQLSTTLRVTQKQLFLEQNKTKTLEYDLRAQNRTYIHKYNTLIRALESWSKELTGADRERALRIMREASPHPKPCADGLKELLQSAPAEVVGLVQD